MLSYLHADQVSNPPKKIGNNSVIIILLALFLLSCAPDSAQEPLSGHNGFFETYVQGQFTLVQKIDKREITVADQVEIVLETSTPENIEIEFPEYETSLGDFTLKDVKTDPARLTGTGDTLQVSQSTVYLLEPYLPGTYSIPPMPVRFLNKDTNTESARLITEEKQITVKSLLPRDGTAVDIIDIKGPLSLPANTGLQVMLVTISLLLIISVVAGFLYWRKISRNRKKPEIQLQPHETAFHELEKLLAEDLLARGKVKLFHLRISDILRHYIEDRFGIKAPDQTTEEFLTALSGIQLYEKSILGSNRTLLAEFLTHCDLVKFAKHEPTTAECKKTVSICREFIEKTKRIENLRN